LLHYYITMLLSIILLYIYVYIYIYNRLLCLFSSRDWQQSNDHKHTSRFVGSKPYYTETIPAIEKWPNSKHEHAACLRDHDKHTHTQITLAKVEAAGWETQGLWDWQNMRRMNLTRHQRGFYVVESGDENLKQMLHPTHSISFLRFMLIHTYYKECNVNMDPPCLLYVYTCVFDYAPWVSKLLCTDVLRGECNDGCFQPTL